MPLTAVLLRDRRSRTETLILAAALVVAAALRFWRLGHQSFWYDESVTVGLLHHSLGGMLNQVPKQEGTPPLYYCLAWLWTRAFGTGEAGVRSLSALAGVLTVAVIYSTGVQLISRRAGAIAAALAACNPFLIWYSQEARAYSLLALMVSLSLLSFAHLLAVPARARWIVAWTLACAATLATHYYGVVAVAPEAAWLLWIHRRDPRVWYAISLVGVVGVALIPLALQQKGNTAWIATLPIGSRLAQLPAQFVRGPNATAEIWLAAAGAGAVLVAVLALALPGQSPPERSGARERPGALIALGLAALGLGLSLVLVAFGVDYLISRNLIAVLLALILAVAGGLASSRWAGSAAGAVLCVVGLIAAVGVATNWRLQRPDWRAVAQSAGIAGTRTPAPQLVIIENIDSLQPIGTYAHTLHGLPPRGAAVRSVILIAATRGPYDPMCWWGAACSVNQAALDDTIHLPGFLSAGMHWRVNQFAIYQLVSPRPVRLTRRRIQLALQPASLRSAGLFVTN